MAVLLAAIVWPTLALGARCVGELGSADAGPFGPERLTAEGLGLSSRQLGLLWRSTWLAGAAALIGVAASIPAAAVLAGVRGRRAFVLHVCLAGVILCPPMVYVFGWQRLLPVGFDPHLQCILVWAAWAWPISAFILSAGWSGSRPVLEAACLSAGPSATIFHILLPKLLPHFAAAAMLLFVLFLGDYGVPHACGLIVYATEMLGWAANSTAALDTVVPSLPPVAVIFAVLLGVVSLLRACSVDRRSEGQACTTASKPWAALAVAIILASWIVPLGVLIVELGSARTISEALRVYGPDIVGSLLVALCAAILVIALAGALPSLGRRSLLLLALWMIALGVLPGALTGKALIVAYNRPATGWVYDDWPIVVLGHVVRFAWIAALAGLVIARGFKRDVALQAAADGADRASVLWHVLLPDHRRLLLAAGCATAVLSLAEVPATSLVRVPTFTPVALAIIEKFHRLENEMLISLSLVLVAASFPAAIALARMWPAPRSIPA